jgi:hypothetical protein
MQINIDDDEEEDNNNNNNDALSRLMAFSQSSAPTQIDNDEEEVEEMLIFSQQQQPASQQSQSQQPVYRFHREQGSRAHTFLSGDTQPSQPEINPLPETYENMEPIFDERQVEELFQKEQDESEEFVPLANPIATRVTLPELRPEGYTNSAADLAKLEIQTCQFLEQTIQDKIDNTKVPIYSHKLRLISDALNAVHTKLDTYQRQKQRRLKQNCNNSALKREE